MVNKIIVTFVVMRDKLQKILQEYQLSSSALAEKMGIQRSGISHIMAGRNKPSYDFLVTLLEKFPDLNANWLLGDDKNMYNTDTPDIDEAEKDHSRNELPGRVNHEKTQAEATGTGDIDSGVYRSKQLKSNKNTEIEFIILFKKDGSFKKYIPEN